MMTWVRVDIESVTPDRTVEHAVRLGAEVIGDRPRWRTLRSPGGLAFCVLDATEHEPPEPIVYRDGHRARMVQVCIDSPASTHDAEVAFWRALVPGRWVESDAAEFAGKWHDDAGSPLQLLFQSLDESDGQAQSAL